MWIIAFLTWSGRILSGVSLITKISSFSSVLKNYWRECIIVLLITMLAGGSWYYKVKTRKLEIVLAETEFNLETSVTNTELLLGQIDGIMEDLNGLLAKNKDLEDDISSAQEQINQMDAIDASIIIREVYQAVLPSNCDDKFSWMLKEALSK